MYYLCLLALLEKWAELCMVRPLEGKLGGWTLSDRVGGAPHRPRSNPYKLHQGGTLLPPHLGNFGMKAWRSRGQSVWHAGVGLGSHEPLRALLFKSYQLLRMF